MDGKTIVETIVGLLDRINLSTFLDAFIAMKGFEKTVDEAGKDLVSEDPKVFMAIEDL